MKKLTIIIFLLTLTQTFAQKVPPLERVISIKISNEKLDESLKLIAKAGNCTFSYNPDVIEINKRISLNAQNQTVREILTEIFNNSVAFKNRGNYIILKKTDEQPKKDFFVMGYVSDGETGLKIEKASIYEPLSLASAVTNEFGFYRIKLSSELNQINLLVRKQNYQNMSVSLKNKQDKMLNIKLLPVFIEKSIPLQPTISTPNLLKSISFKTDTLPNKKLDSIPPIQVPPTIIDSTIAEKKSKFDYKKEWEETKETINEKSEEFSQWFLNKKQNIHLKNVKDTLYRPVQISFLPFIGTNHVMSGNVINDLSFNIIGGYSLGVRVLEVGGVFNLVRGNVRGVQIAGTLNLNGGKMFGVQTAGFLNANFGNSAGVMASGFTNFAGKSYFGVQAAGFSNVVIREMKSGVQAAGFMNFVGKNFDGVQAAGFMNFVGKTMRGLQVAPYNYALEVNNGLQIGVFNYAKKSNSIPIGVLSYVGNGYRRFELNADELFGLNVIFKTGVNRFYNVFTASYNFNSTNRPAYSYGYGLGTAWRINRFFWINLDVVSSKIQVNRTEIEWNRLNQLIKTNLGLEYHLTKRVAIFVAPTLNFLATDGATLDLGKLEKFRIYEKNVDWFGQKANLTSWFGYQIGLRICNKL